MSNSVLNAKLRERTGKTGSKNVRKDGLIPAILYGKDMDPLSLSINPNELKTALDTDAGINTLLELKIENMKENSKKILSLIKDYQVDPITSQTLHIDFHSIDIDEKIEVTVPINLIGRSAGEKEGGMLEHVLREIELICLPSNIPNSIDIDISELNIGDSIHISDLSLDKDVETTRNEEEMIVGVVTAEILETESPIEAEEAGEAGEAGDDAEAEQADEGEADSGSEEEN